MFYLLDAEHAIQRILGTKGFNCPQPILNIKGQDKSIEDVVYDLPVESDEKISTAEFQGNCVNRFNYFPNIVLFGIDYAQFQRP